MGRLHRDNFRFLTGFGRDMMERVEWVLDDWKIDVGMPAPTGNLVLYVYSDESRYEFIPHTPSPLDRQSVGGIEATRTVSLSIVVQHANGLSETTDLPLVMVLANTADDFVGTYQVYQHDFIEPGGTKPTSGGCYIGITKRGWRKRWSEHLSAARSGSHYRFHKAIREWYGVSKSMGHSIIACNLSERQALVYEEDIVRDTLYPLGLNMVPGGNAGLAYLRRIGALGKHERISPDDRQDIINRFFEHATRKGLPNPLAAANWLDPSYAEKVICAGPDRLKPQQIRDARYFASLGHEPEHIATQIDARNVAQIKRLLAGDTYSRIT